MNWVYCGFMQWYLSCNLFVTLPLLHSVWRHMMQQQWTWERCGKKRPSVAIFLKDLTKLTMRYQSGNTAEIWNRIVANTNKNRYRITHFYFDCLYTVMNPLFSLKKRSLDQFISHSSNNYLRCRLLSEKLTDTQLVTKVHVFCGTWNFIAAFKRTCHPSLSWARSFQFIPPIALLESPF